MIFNQQKKRYALYILIVLLLVVLIFLIAFSNPRLSKINGFKIIDAEGGNLNVALSLSLRNSNLFPISADRFYFSIVYESDTLVRGSAAREFKLAMLEDSDVDFLAEIDLENLSQHWPVISKTDSITATVYYSGSFTAMKIGYSSSLQMPFSSRQLLDVFFQKQFGKNGIKIRNLRPQAGESPLAFKWNFDIELTNPVPEPLTIQNISLKVYADQEFQSQVGKVNLVKDIVLEPGRQMPIPVVMDIRLDQMLGGIFQKVLNPDMNFYVKGNCEVTLLSKPFIIPFHTKVNPGKLIPASVKN